MIEHSEDNAYIKKYHLSFAKPDVRISNVTQAIHLLFPSSKRKKEIF